MRLNMTMEFYSTETFKILMVSAIVIVFHLGWIGWLAFIQEPPRITSPQTRLHVQTINLQRAEPVKAVEKTAALSKPEAPPKVEAPQATVDTEKPKVPIAPVKAKEPVPTIKKNETIVKKEVQKPTPTLAKPVTKPVPQKPGPTKDKAPVKDLVAEAAAIKKKNLLAEAKKNIDKMISTSKSAVNSKNRTADLAAPTTLKSLNVDSISMENASFGNAIDLSYGNELANRLKLLLRLPQYGDVDIQLTIQRSGKVAKLVILESGNSINKAHIEKTIPSMIFPSFGTGFPGEEEHTFKIKLSHELSH